MIKNDKNFYKLLKEWKKQNTSETNIDKKISNDKFKVLEEMTNVFFEKKEKAISLIGNHGSGKTKVINEFFSLIKKTNNKDICIKIDVWELFGLRSPNDYKGELKTAFTFFNENGDRKIYSYYIENAELDEFLEEAKENLEKEKHYDFATKLNIRKIIWRSIISKILKNTKENILFKLITFIKKIKMRRISKILKNNSEKKVNIYNWWIIAFFIVFFIVLFVASILIAIFLGDQNNTIAIFSISFASISFLTPIISLFLKRPTFNTTLDINEFLLDESNFSKIQEWIEWRLKKRKLYIHIDNIDRLNFWIEDNKIKYSSLIRDIIQTLHLMYKIEDVYIMIEMNNEVLEIIDKKYVGGGDIARKILGNIIEVKSISESDIEKHFLKKGQDLNKMQKLFAKDYYDLIVKFNPNHLSYRLLKTEYIPNFLQLLENRAELLETNINFYESNVYKSEIARFLLQKRVKTTETINHFSWEKKDLCVFDHHDKNEKPLQSIFKWMNGIEKLQKGDYDCSEFLNFNNNLPTLKKINFEKGLILKKWIQEDYLYIMNHENSKKDPSLFFKALMNFLKSKKYNVKIDTNNFSDFFVEKITRKIVKANISNMPMECLNLAAFLGLYNKEKALKLTNVLKLDPIINGPEYFKKNYYIFECNQKNYNYARDNMIKDENIIKWIEGISIHSIEDLKYFLFIKKNLSDNDFEVVYQELFLKNKLKGSHFKELKSKNKNKIIKFIKNKYKQETPQNKGKITKFIKKCRK